MNAGIRKAGDLLGAGGGQALTAMALVFGLAACGTDSSSVIRYEFTPHQPDQWTNTVDNVTVTAEIATEIPSLFRETVPVCELDEDTGLPVYEKDETENVSLLPEGVMVLKVTIANRTDQVLRMPLVVQALTDPADQQYYSLRADELKRRFQKDQACPMSRQLAYHFNTLELLHRETEVPPHRTRSGHAVFLPKDPKMTGVWTVTLYDMPVETDVSGLAKKRAHLTSRFNQSKLVDVHTRMSGESQDTITTRDLSKGGTPEEMESAVVSEREAAHAAAEKEAEAKAAAQEGKQGEENSVLRLLRETFQPEPSADAPAAEAKPEEAKPNP